MCIVQCASLVGAHAYPNTCTASTHQWGHYSWPSMKKRGYMTPFILLISVLLVMRLIPYVEEGLIGDWGVGCTFCLLGVAW